jgi:hypothetical protein
LALVGAALFVLGPMGVATPQVDGSMDPLDPGPSPLTVIGLLLFVFGGLLGYATHLISRE